MRYLFLSIACLCATTLISNPLTKQRTHEKFFFKLSFIPGTYEPSLRDVVSIGIYNPHDYKRLAPYGVIELDPKISYPHINPNLIQTYKSTSHIADTKKFITDTTISLRIMFMGKLDAQDSTNRIFNLIFHTAAQAITGEKFPNINLPMGIFDARGVTAAPSASIAFNALTPQNVNVHPSGEDIAYSPNNARFKIGADPIVSFYAAAYSPEKKYASITFFIIATTQESEDALRQILTDSKNTGDIIAALKTYAQTVQASHRATIQNAADTLYKLVTGLAPAPIPADSRPLEKSLENLAEKLTDLAQALAV